MEKFGEYTGSYVIFALGIIGSIFGLVLTVLERKLLVTRKPVAGSNGFSVTVLGGITGAIGIWQITDNYYYMAIYFFSVIIAYIIICILIKKKDYPEKDRFTKE